MSQKWIRSKKWDDEHIPSWAWPAKALLRAFSSIPLAVVLLIGVSMYGTLASVPIGLIALAPTWLIYSLSLLLTIGFLAIIPTLLVTRRLRAGGTGRAARFGVGFFGVIALSLLSIYLWHRFAWPVIRYNEATGSGLRLFTEFVKQNKAVTVRRLPGMEMSELEFYAWWPLKVLLIAFVINMVTATVRRIEFSFPYIGVLTVHTGIVVLALGSMYYSALKEEGDTLLMSGAIDSDDKPTPGPPVTGFYDNTRVALWVGDGTTLRQVPLKGVPRYHDYNLNAMGLAGLDDWARQFDEGRSLSTDIRSVTHDGNSMLPASLNGVSMRLVGYAPYANVSPQWVPASPAEVAALKTPALPVRNFEMVISGSGGGGANSARISDRTQLFPTIPAGRIQPIGLGMVLEYTSGMPAERWADLNTPVNAGAMHSMITEVHAGGGTTSVKEVITLVERQRLAVGNTGYELEVMRLVPSLLQLLEEGRKKGEELPIAIDDPLYSGVDTSLAVVRVHPPAAKNEAPYFRFVFSRFPEKSIDIFDTAPPSGRLGKRPADSAIRLSYLDDSVPQYYVDEAVGESTDPGNPVLRGVMRPRGGAGDGKPVALTGLKPGFVISLGPVAGLRIAERWAHATAVEYPMPVPENQRDNKELGTHRNAAIAIEIVKGESKQVVWLPFSQYALTEQQNARHVELSDGTHITLAFGRYWRSLPDLQLQLADFHMYSHDFGGPTQDFRSDLVVLKGKPGTDKTSMELRYTSLNDPLLVRVPFRPREGASSLTNFVGWMVSGIAPTQYKFSQAGWDPEGWNKTQAEVDAGTRKRPFAGWTILGVGNNPGIYVIAAGAIMMVVGIPWAFYVKPYIMKRRKQKIQKELAAKAAKPKPIEEPVEVTA